MATVFISHASQDKGFAKQLCDDLRVLGHTPWIDDLDICPGESIVSAIQDGLSGSRYVIVVLSQKSVQSRWVDAEWKETLWDSITHQKIKVIPVLREKCDVPLFLRTLRRADFSESYAVGFAILCMTMKAAVPQVPKELVCHDFLRAMEYDAHHHNLDHVRIACAHTVGSCRPDRAKPVLEDALTDQRDVVSQHAQTLLDHFY